MAAIENEKVYALKIRESADDGSDFGTPDADYRFLFLGEDGDLHVKDASDVVTDFPAGGGSGAPTDAEYVVTAANGTLSAEKVVTAPATGGVIPKIVVKVADETINGSSTLQDDDELLLAIGANEKWDFECRLWFTSGTTPDFKWAVTVPTGATLMWVAMNGVTAAGGNLTSGSATTTSGEARDVASGAGTRGQSFLGTVLNGANAGNLQIQWAQNTSNGTDTIVLAGSTLKGWKLA